MFFASACSQAHFIFSKKVPGKKCHLLPHLPRHLTFFSVVSSPGIFCVFGDKSAWEKKSACKPGLQVSAYYAGLLEMSFFYHYNARCPEVLKARFRFRTHCILYLNSSHYVCIFANFSNTSFKSKTTCIRIY